MRVLKIKDYFVMQSIGDEYIVVPIAIEADNLNGVIRLNKTGAYIWDLLTKENMSESELIEAITKSYPVTKSDAQKDLQSFLKKLDNLGCLIY